MDTKTVNIILKAKDQASQALDKTSDAFKRMESSVQRTTEKMGNVGRKMQDVGKKATLFVTLPIVAAGGKMVKAFSDLEETMNKVDVSFRDQSATIKEWSTTSLDSMLIAQQTALDSAALFGDMGTSMGQTTGEAANMSMSLTQLSSDLSSFKNVSFERAQTALAGVYTGETEALKSLGVIMTQTELKAFALAKGIDKNLESMTQAEKVQLRYEFIMKNTANAHGDAANTAGSLANQSRKTSERIKQLSAEFGKKLAPMMSKVLEIGNKILGWFGNMSDTQQTAVLMIVGFLAVLGPLVAILGTLATAIQGVSVAMTFLAANPIVLAIIAIILIIAGLAFLIIKNWDTLKRWFGTFFGFLKKLVSGAVNFIKSNWDKLLVIFLGPLGLILAVIIKNFGKIRAVIGAAFGFIKSAAVSAWNFISGIWNRASGLFGRIGSGIKNGIRSGIEGAKGIVKGGINFIIDKINGIIRGVNNTAGRIPGVPNIPQLPRLQKGTHFFGGGLAVVGEKGPEVVAMPRGSKVIPNSQSGDFLDEQGTGKTVNVTNNIFNQVDMDLVAQDIAWRLST